MIGVIAKQSEVEIVKEFFQLFKTPWKFYQNQMAYDIVITTEEPVADIDAKLCIIYNSAHTEWDKKTGLSHGSKSQNTIIRFRNIRLPIYGQIATFSSTFTPLVTIDKTSDAAGVEIRYNNKKFLRIGYDLFEEVALLLSKGQPIEDALIPALEIHIAMLRSWIIDAGIPLVEIPPVPAGYDFITCLTHDVDFIRIRDHLFDHTMAGFLYRAIICSLKNVVKNKTGLSYAIQNLKAILSLPFVSLGLVKDFWFQFDRYQEIEKDVCSTYFISPYKNRQGDNIDNPVPSRRAMRYDIDDIKETALKLIDNGDEIGVHGIDAWHSSEKGLKERQRIAEITKKPDTGMRMHWLCRDDNTAQKLDKAGYFYDSTCGYNETPGYRAGTTQAFLPKGSRKMLELPMHIQDTALFYPSYLDLSEAQALSLCKQFTGNALRYGGVLTVLWHQRSLAPERLWGNTYKKLLEEIKTQNVWFGTAGQVTKWFGKRRALHFNSLHIKDNTVFLTTDTVRKDSLPSINIRVYPPDSNNKKKSEHPFPEPYYIDTPLIPGKEMHITF